MFIISEEVIAVVCSHTTCSCTSRLTAYYSTVKIVKCTCAYSSTVPGWSDYLGIPGYSEKEGWCGLYLSSSWHLPSMVRVSQDTLRKGGGVACISYHPGAFPVWSELKISVYSDERGWCGLHMCSSWYYPGRSEYFGSYALVWYKT